MVIDLLSKGDDMEVITYSEYKVKSYNILCEIEKKGKEQLELYKELTKLDLMPKIHDDCSCFSDSSGKNSKKSAKEENNCASLES